MPQGLGRLGRELALDWGTSWTRLYQRGKGVVLEAPSLIATRREMILTDEHDQIERQFIAMFIEQWLVASLVCQ